jgi:hypothetical protein
MELEEMCGVRYVKSILAGEMWGEGDVGERGGEV